MRINLHIERLVLDGLPLGSWQGAHVRSAIEAELVRMLAAGGLPQRWGAGGAMPEVPAQRFELGPRELPQSIGRQIACSIHRGIGGAP